MKTKINPKIRILRIIFGVRINSPKAIPKPVPSDILRRSFKIRRLNENRNPIQVGDEIKVTNIIFSTVDKSLKGLIMIESEKLRIVERNTQKQPLHM